MNLQNRLQTDYAHLQNKSKNPAVREASIRRLHHLLAPHLPLNIQTALDLGAGQGELIEALERLGFMEVNGVELSPSQVELAHQHGCTSVRLGEGLHELESFPDASLDLVCCFDVFEHLNHATCAEWFAQIQRVLRPGGRLIGHVPNGLSPFSGWVWGDLTHVWCPVPESMHVFCRSCGLRWVGAYENIGSSRGFKGLFRRLCWEIVRAFFAASSTVETGEYAFGMPWSRTFLFVAECIPIGVHR